MSYFLYAIAAIIGLISIILVIGAMLPVKHVASKSTNLKASNAQVWGLMTDYKNAANWRTDLVKATAETNDENIEIIYEYENEKSFMAFETLEEIGQQKLVRRIYGKNLPFGGTWTFELQKTDVGTRLTITENGEIHNILFRFVAKFIMGHDATILNYIKDIEQAVAKDL